MNEGLSLVLSGCFFAALAWASWHWWSDYFTLAVLVIVLLEYAVDNFRLQSLVALCEKKGRG